MAVLHAINDEQNLKKMGGLINIIPFTYTMILIGSLSLMALPFLTGFYSKDVRGAGQFTVISEEIEHFSNMFTTLELGERENLNLNRASLVIKIQFLNLLGD
jgi:NADH:ubiquinone oxidoreductase subunit 5 (subunit L)/multisubunit Na+/H+ antiporter MnhA subunit